MSEGWIIVPNWERFQHYSDRDPRWIKVYTELQSRDDWRSLSLALRGLILCIWLENARSHGLLRVSDIPSRVAQKVPRRSLDSLREAGWIEVSASKPSRARADAPSRELEKEKERETPPTPPSERGAKKLAEKSRAKAERWIANGAAAEVPPERLGDVIADEFGLTDPEIVTQLAAQARERTP